ncbi:MULTISPECIES: hypothetical protein [Streptomyces]|uniref:hypothetical protein n=1 Tax=Streptomyces TaxID=1883 RepID=UPI00131A4C00|nr:MULTISPECIES: hypothetical protein [Streptomyces]
MDALKVGITSKFSKTDRIQAHIRRGWDVGIVIPFAYGTQARQAERALIGLLRACGATETLQPERMPQGGYTETVAFARTAGITLAKLAEIASTAAGVVMATDGPLYLAESLNQAISELMREIEHFTKEEKKAIRAPILELIRVLDKLITDLGSSRVD